MKNLTLSLEDNPDPQDIQAAISKILKYNNNSQQNKVVTNLPGVLMQDACFPNLLLRFHLLCGGGYFPRVLRHQKLNPWVAWVVPSPRILL
ncbi:hypothetical protein ACN23B_25060 [Anabaena sp. FACHB-709]|uniref:Uncharacterized protein n=2 Tax=Nostocaceae TaxID=1162 RepID=A0A1Z4KNM4_ANAVA|nr:MULTISPECIES: hypothetical protein [Nostocaceae]BAY70600.1 hypothetical protein NIES23_34070 [Trichormus variabilis NIES-23]MBD2172565.1 hypothetical protein [Anabaena cylindrica FACHB-318]MBD2264463.1 hypothetical protein [Anabaena sp. FACHB-709]MBD2274234.1 hypothetical protein [Nostoc sp. PCC 7120 = FACHB-418]MBD2284723.1 hypothetical protein [Anabaena cylindrica FACHB-170]